MAPKDPILDILYFLDSNEVEKCQLVCQKWNSTILENSKLLPFRSFHLLRIVYMENIAEYRVVVSVKPAVFDQHSMEEDQKSDIFIAEHDSEKLANVCFEKCESFVTKRDQIQGLARILDKIMNASSQKIPVKKYISDVENPKKLGWKKARLMEDETVAQNTEKLAVDKYLLKNYLNAQQVDFYATARILFWFNTVPNPPENVNITIGSLKNSEMDSFLEFVRGSHRGQTSAYTVYVRSYSVDRIDPKITFMTNFCGLLSEYFRAVSSAQKYVRKIHFDNVITYHNVDDFYANLCAVFEEAGYAPIADEKSCVKRYILLGQNGWKLTATIDSPVMPNHIIFEIFK